MQIRKLQAILEAREDEERQKNDTQEIIPIVMNGKQDSPPLQSPRSKVSNQWHSNTKFDPIKLFKALQQYASDCVLFCAKLYRGGSYCTF